MRNKFSFKLGDMYEDMFGYDTVFHAELNSNGEYHVTWYDDEEGTEGVPYTVEEAKDSIDEGFWILIK